MLYLHSIHVKLINFRGLRFFIVGPTANSCIVLSIDSLTRVHYTTSVALSLSVSTPALCWLLNWSIHIFEIVHDFLYECHLAKEFLHVAQHNCAQLVLHLLVSVDQAVYILFVSASVIELSHLWPRSHLPWLWGSSLWLFSWFQICYFERLLFIRCVGFHNFLELSSFRGYCRAGRFHIWGLPDFSHGRNSEFV